LLEKVYALKLMSVTPVSNPAFMNLVVQQARALSAKHEVLSNNITNITTPGYKAVDVQLAQNFKELLGVPNTRKGKLQLTLTSSSHLQSSNVLVGSVPTVLQTDVEEKPNGNNVSLTGEALRMVQNQQKYDEALNIYNSSNNLIKSVIGKDND
jgi:flagellar basal-body rod protein FlgB